MPALMLAHYNLSVKQYVEHTSKRVCHKNNGPFLLFHQSRKLLRRPLSYTYTHKALSFPYQRPEKIICMVIKIVLVDSAIKEFGNVRVVAKCHDTCSRTILW